MIRDMNTDEFINEIVQGFEGYLAVAIDYNITKSRFGNLHFANKRSKG